MQKRITLLAALIGAGLISANAAPTNAAAKKDEHKETPMLPGLPWHVHDMKRPVPHLVTPGTSFSQNAPPPSDAEVLFNGTDLSKWKGDKGPATWKVENGYMEVAKKAGSITTKDEFGDFQLHLEFATPEKVEGDSQGRGNSGIFLMGKFEVQVLDSYNNRTYADGQCGALYGQTPPLVNPVRKPGEWQSYDIIFEAPRWDDSGQLVKRGNVTVLLNGVLLHHKKEFIGDTRHAEVGVYGKPQSRGPIQLQDHGNPMRFRNIWLRPIGEYDKP